MGIIGCLDQLDVHAHGVAALLHASFQNVGDPKLLGDFGQVFRRAFVLLRRSARDHLQIRDLGQAGQDFLLNAVGKVRVRFVLTPVFER
jgi:hypothetical protein